MPATSTADLVLEALRAADRPLTVAEVRQRIRNDTGAAIDRTTLAAALKRLMIQSVVSRDVGEGGVQVWHHTP
jgi:hypothetical protein